jgi:hypothetical protein
MYLRDVHGLISVWWVEENDGGKRGVYWFPTGDNLASFFGKGRSHDSEIPRIECDSYIRNPFDPGRDLNLALLQLFSSEGAYGTENQGIVLHVVLLSYGALDADGLAKNGVADEQRDYEPAPHVAPIADTGTAKVSSLERSERGSVATCKKVGRFRGEDLRKKPLERFPWRVRNRTLLSLM